MHEFDNPRPLTPVLWLRCLVRDEQAWSSLSAYYRPMLAAYACRLLSRSRDDPDGEQIACDVLERLFFDECRLLRAFDPSKNLDSYLRMLTHSAVRRRRCQPRIDDCHERWTEDMAPARMHETSWREQLEQLSQTLTKAERELVRKWLEPRTDGSLAPAMNDAERQTLRGVIAKIRGCAETIRRVRRRKSEK